MKSILSLLLLAGLAEGGARSAKDAAGHPIERVVILLEELVKEVTKQGQDEEVTFAKFTHWCQISEKTMNKAISEGKTTIESLKTKIEAHKKHEEQLTTEISELETEILQYTNSATEATNARSAAAALYTTADADMASTISAIEDAITGLQESAGALVQNKAVLKLLQSPLIQETLTEHQRAFLVKQQGGKQDPDVLAAGDAAAHVQQYDFKSDNVIDLLKELVRKFEDDRVTGTVEETNSINAYNLAKQARDAAKAAAEASKTEKEGILGTAQGDRATAENDLTTAEGDLTADETTVSDTIQMCKMKQTEWDERSKLREHEILAMEEAVKILAKVSGVRTEAPSNPVPPPSPVAFLQHAPRLVTDSNSRERALNLLRKTATKYGSKQFKQFAERVATAAGGPFDEVNNMVQKMIFQLMAEQKDEDDHKNWCDMEVTKTKTSETTKEEKIAEYETKIGEAVAKTTLLAEEFAEAQAMIARITEHMAEATEIREIGKKENAEAVKDAKNAQNALAQAVSIITAHYKESGMIALQASAPVTLPENPATWDSSYTGVADPKAAGDGIITILEEVSSEFSRMEADTKAQESTDQKEFQNDMKACEIDKSRRETESAMKENERKRLVGKTADMAKAKKHVDSELHAVKQYMKDLSPACLEGDSTYDDRKAARTAEVEALKQAQVILAGAFEGGPAPAPAPAAASAFLARVASHLH